MKPETILSAYKQALTDLAFLSDGEIATKIPKLIETGHYKERGLASKRLRQFVKFEKAIRDHLVKEVVIVIRNKTNETARSMMANSRASHSVINSRIVEEGKHAIQIRAHEEYLVLR